MFEALETKPLKSIDFKSLTIQVHEPFAEFLMATPEEHSFEISLLDVVRFAGHACPSMVGAFLIAARAVNDLYPENGICERGDLRVELSTGPTAGASGPIANVFSFITGAWSETGFGGFQGHFARRGLLSFNSGRVPAGAFRFTRLSNGRSIDVFYDPSRAKVQLDPNQPFQAQWRVKIAAIIDQASECVWTQPAS